MGSLSMVGRVLLLVGCTAAGNYLAARPMRRYRELMDAAQLVGELQSRLQYSLLPAAELLEQLSQEPRFCALPYLRRFAAGKTDFPQRWQQAVQDCGGEFDADSRALLALHRRDPGLHTDLSQQSLTAQLGAAAAGAGRTAHFCRRAPTKKGCTPLWAPLLGDGAVHFNRIAKRKENKQDGRRFDF